MIHAQNVETEVLITPVSASTGASVTGVLDTLGSNYVTIDLINNTGATALSALAITEGADTNASDAITVFTGGTATGNFTIPAANTSAAPHVRFNIDCRKRKRYLKLSATAGVTGILGAVVHHYRTEETPTNAPGAVVSG